MATYRQILRYKRLKSTLKKKSKALKGNPQKRAICVRVYITTPRKPNSAKRKVARVNLRFKDNKKKIINIKTITICIPGPATGPSAHNLKKYSKLLIRGGNVRDIPGVRYRAIRGKLDLIA